MVFKQLSELLTIKYFQKLFNFYFIFDVRRIFPILCFDYMIYLWTGDEGDSKFMVSRYVNYDPMSNWKTIFHFRFFLKTLKTIKILHFILCIFYVKFYENYV